MATGSGRATSREWIGLAVIALPCLIYAMDLTVLNLAVPHLTADLEPSATQLLWIVDIYGFLVAGALVTMGTLGDRIGRRRLLMIGAAAFGVASVLAAFAPTVPTLIAARALLGLAGATFAPSTLSLIRNMFHDPGERTFAIGVWGTAYSVGGTVGPILGGVLLEYFWWGSVFLLAVPVMVLLLAVAPVLLPEYRDPTAGRIDLLSAGLSVLAVLAVIFGLKQAAEHGLGWLPVASVVLGLGLGTAFVGRQRRLADPFIDLGLFRSPAFCAALGTNVAGVFIVFGTFVFIAQYLQLVLGLSPLLAGLWMLPGSLAVIVGSLLSSAIVKRVPPAQIIAGGFALVALGLAVLSRVGGEGSLGFVVAGQLILSIGLGPIFILTTDLIVGTAPPERAGAAAAMSETGAELGGALGIAILGSVGVAVYRGMMAAGVPAGVDGNAAEAARGTLGAAAGVAGRLPEALAAPLLAAARTAFASGFQVIAIIGAAIAVAVAIVATALLRRARPTRELG